DDDFGADQVAPVAAGETKAEPVILADVGDIAQDRHRLVDAADDDVEPAVVIEVADGEAATDVRLLEEIAAAPAGVLETASADVAQQDRRLLQGGAAGRVANDVAVGDDDVLQTMMVEVDKRRAEADVFLSECRDAGAGGAVVKHLL